MKIFVAGGNGFIGKNVVRELSRDHEVIKGTRSVTDDTSVAVDLLDKSQIAATLREMNPDIIINCAGVVSSEGDFNHNVEITKNLLEGAAEAHIGLKRYVLCGSAGEYGPVSPDELPVSEDQPLRAANPYAVSKVREEVVARDLADEYGIELIVARIFNPLGTAMPEKFLLTNLLGQINDIKEGKKQEVTVSRLDATRDYIDIHDLSVAIAGLATHSKLNHDTYNIGSGVASTTGEVVRYLLEYSGAPENTPIAETSDSPEGSLASQADITRLKQDIDWEPTSPLRKIIEGAVEKYNEQHK